MTTKLGKMHRADDLEHHDSAMYGEELYEGDEVVWRTEPETTFGVVVRTEWTEPSDFSLPPTKSYRGYDVIWSAPPRELLRDPHPNFTNVPITGFKILPPSLRTVRFK